MKRFVLAGDIGGTNSRFALHVPFESEAVVSHVYANEEALKEGLRYEQATLVPFLEKCREAAQWEGEVEIVACLAVAGAVEKDNSVVLTNIGEGCRVDGRAIEESAEGLLKSVVRCQLVNDFVGQGYGALDLDLATECEELLPGSRAKIDPLGPKACVGAGTGLGQCFLTRSSLHPHLGYECYPSEGGHVDFAPRDKLQTDLHDFLKRKFHAAHRVSVERVVSGRGLANVYEFLAQAFPDRIDPLVHSHFLEAGDQQGRVVGVNSSTEGSLTRQAAEIMIAAYGAEVANAALKFIPTGGMFVTGGLTPKNMHLIRGIDSPFMTAYLDKGRLTPLLHTVPLFAVMSEDIGLRGARVCAEQIYKSQYNDVN